jgi:hypothetical protein
VLAWLFTVSYAHRNPLALFGLDAVNMMLTMYLMLGPCGAVWSLDRLLSRGRARAAQDRAKEAQRLAAREVAASDAAPELISANFSTRLIQCHMCLIYLFSALGKLQGETWWDGSAIWFAVGNLEYQAWDATWIAAYPLLGNFITQTTVLWELSYAVLIWPRLWRPLMLALAVPLHLGIGLWLGMPSFGVAMLIGNMAFVEPWVLRALLGRK